MSEKVIALNKKAHHDFFLEDRFEAGIELKGSEIKSIRLKKVQLKDSFVSFHDGQAFIKSMTISKYQQANLYFDHDEQRERRLLLHKHQIVKLFSKTRLDGYTVIPVRLYLTNGKAKLEIALAKGKDLHDKRQSQKVKDLKREALKALKR